MIPIDPLDEESQRKIQEYSLKRLKYSRVIELLMGKGTLGTVQREDVRHALDVCEWIEEEIEKRVPNPFKPIKQSSNHNEKIIKLRK